MDVHNKERIIKIYKETPWDITREMIEEHNQELRVYNNIIK